MKFSLETYGVNNRPAFVTLSYCWGDLSSPSNITVNDQPFVVSRNLADALQHAWPYLRSQATDANHLLWIDQICINQNDDEERADQVGLMRDLYCTSSFTIAWLGGADDSSSLALELLTRDKGVYSAPGRGKLCQPQKEQRKEYYEKRSLLRALDDREYWKRMWIMQEFILPPKLLMLCGTMGVWWDDVQRCHGLDDKFCVHMAPLFRRRTLMHSQACRFQFVKLLNMAKYRACTRPFDRVFALLGLIMPEDLEGLRVDYGMPPPMLFRHVVRLLERLVKSEKGWMQLTKDLAEALELPMSERALSPPAWKWSLNVDQNTSDAIEKD